jgi:acetamidase/formamidase
LHEFVVSEPLITVKPGERFTMETEDALNGLIRTPDRLPIAEHLKVDSLAEFRGNPVGGAVYVEGSHRGDTLVVEVIDVVPDDIGVTCFFPGIGPLQDSAQWAECRGPFTQIIRHVPDQDGNMAGGKAVIDGRTRWSLQPFIGTIGVAPSSPIRDCADTGRGQGVFGGNLDCRDIRKGSKVFLPVFHDGAYLFAGDVHASQADTEFTGVADETRGKITLSCDLVRGRSIPAPRVEKKESIIQLKSGRPVDESITQAVLLMMDWLVQDHEMSKREAYMSMSIDPDVRVHVYQMCATLCTVGVEFPKNHLP